VLAVHYVEIYWIVTPQLRPSSAWPHWLDAAAAAAVLGFGAAWVSWRVRGAPAVPVGDPELVSALRYHAT
jgi:hypothetical protein